LQSEQQARREKDDLHSELQNTTEQVKKQGSKVDQLKSKLQNWDMSYCYGFSNRLEELSHISHCNFINVWRIAES